MGVEIERKFLLRGDGWRALGEPVLQRQGYLSSHSERVVRVRIEGALAMLTIKSRNVGASRGEWEYPIPVDEAQVLLVNLAKDLAAKGEIMLTKNRADDELVY